MKPRILFLLVVILGRVYGLQAQHAQHAFSSLQEVWAYAAAHNVQVGYSYAQKQVAARSVRQARDQFLPSIGLNGGFTDNISIQPTLVPAELFGGEPGTFVEETFGKRYNYNAGLSAQLDLINTTNWFTLRGAHYEQSVTDLKWKLDRQDLYVATANAYFGYFLMQEAATLAAGSLHAAEEMATHTSNLYQQGQVSEVVLNIATINIRNASLVMLGARRNQRQALNQLKQVLELSVADSLVLRKDSLLTDGVVGMPWDPANDLKVKLSYQQVLSASNGLQSARATYAPTLSAVYVYNTQLTGNTFLDFENTNSLPQQYWGLRLTVPLLTHGTRAFQVSKARVDYDNKMKIYESALNQSTLESDNLLFNFQTAKEKLRGAKEILELYRRNDTHAAMQLSAGQISIGDRLRAYQDYLAYQTEYIRSVSDFYISYAECMVRQQPF